MFSHIFLTTQSKISYLIPIQNFHTYLPIESTADIDVLVIASDFVLLNVSPQLPCNRLIKN